MNSRRVSGATCFSLSGHASLPIAIGPTSLGRGIYISDRVMKASAETASGLLT